MPRNLGPGVYGPLPTFFDDHQQINYDDYRRHLLNAASQGIIPVFAGSLGEALHLTHEERVSLIRFIRKTLDENGFEDRPIVAGVGGSCTMESIKLAKDASEAGADVGMVILPSYYAASLTADQEQVIQYYVDICESSPIPILLYNFPANSAGQDMSSDVIEAIMRRTTNLCGVKLTCPGSVGKLIRLKSTLSSDQSLNDTRPFPFLLLDGLIADLRAWKGCDGDGTVSGISNFAPKATMRFWQLLNKSSLEPKEAEELSYLESALSRADVHAVPAGVRGMKYALHRMHGYSITPRRPLLPLRQQEGDRFMAVLEDVLRIESTLA